MNFVNKYRQLLTQTPTVSCHLSTKVNNSIKIYKIYKELLTFSAEVTIILCFPSDDTVKQADVVLLGYPLMVDMTEEERRNDLDIYEKVDKFKTCL